MATNELDWSLESFSEKDKDKRETGSSTAELKQEFIAACEKYITDPKRRPGLSRLLGWLENQDFYTAPASTRYHGAYNGGLVEHSLDVLEFALKMAPVCETQLSTESIAVAALFHDVCKVNFYKTESRRQKIDNEWRDVQCYTIDEAMPFGGHGSKSVYLISSCMKLTPDEATAINCHMGFADLTGNSTLAVSNAYERYPLAWLIHVADEAATFIRKRK